MAGASRKSKAITMFESKASWTRWSKEFQMAKGKRQMATGEVVCSEGGLLNLPFEIVFRLLLTPLDS